MFMMFNKNNNEDNNSINNDSMLNCKTIKEKQQLLRKKVYDIIFDPDTELNIKNPDNIHNILNVAIRTKNDICIIIIGIKSGLHDLNYDNLNLSVHKFIQNKDKNKDRNIEYSWDISYKDPKFGEICNLIYERIDKEKTDDIDILLKYI